jgi:hypothetical protein
MVTGLRTKDGNESVDLWLTLSYKEIKPIDKYLKNLIGLITPLEAFS